ncbi:TetR/AcrR family transcriptional regulator [Labrys sp. KB_33_2]|uniref:TetR/AcrR family transcriptional regulator n=1 Tax=Labrys sp. KB_33_2 TaxID=3237479 RepID=UPI003F9009DB
MPVKGNDDMIACARQMLRIARRKFFTKPYDAVSMEEIATRAGLSEAKAFDLFASQEELFASLVVQEMAAAAVEIWCSTKAASASFRPATGAITAMHHRPPSSDALRRRRRLAARQSIDRERIPRVKHAKTATSSAAPTVSKSSLRHCPEITEAPPLSCRCLTRASRGSSSTSGRRNWIAGSSRQ